MVPKKSKKKIEKNNESSDGEDAFIFYRPGKDKKWYHYFKVNQALLLSIWD